MLLSRVFKPKKNDLIYHYCSAEAFHAICTNKTIRLCDIHSMNDFLEMHWGYSIWEKAASELLDEVGRDFLDKIDEILHISGIKGLLLSSSFSLDGDVLSQWRAYADDGNGYAIGFKASDIIQLPVRTLKVEYNIKKQIKEVKKVIKAIFDTENLTQEKFGDDFNTICYLLSYDLASYKNPAFSEEKEIRLIHLLSFKPSNNFLKLVDDGGHSFGKDINYDVNFIMTQNAPRAYIDINFTNEVMINPIKEVIIGPKNFVKQTAISIYLETLGIGSVKVSKSSASYR